MRRYEYKLVEIPAKRSFQGKAGGTFEACKEVILAQAEQGWRLKQVVVPFNEKMGVYGTDGYQVIFEREA